MRRVNRVLQATLCICLFSALALGSGSSSNTSSTAQKVGEVDKSESSATSEETEEPAEKKTEESASAVKNDVKDKYYVGDTFSYEGLSITYVSSSNYVTDNEFLKPADGNKIVRIALHVDNQSGSDKTVSSFDFKCYADGYDANGFYGADDDLSASLSNGRTADGAIYFEVPADAAEIEVEYEYDWINSKKTLFIFEGDKDSGATFEKNTEANAEAYHVGDVIETKNLRIKYLNAAEYKSDNMFLEPKDGYNFVYIELEVENLSNTDQLFSYFSFNCYADGVSCDGFYGMDDAISSNLSSGRKAKGTVAFEVPKDAQSIEFEFEDNLWTDSKIIFLYE